MKNNNAWRRSCLTAVLLGSVWGSLPAQADNMSFHGRLIEQQPCTVNNGENIRIDFGDVIITEVDGVNYQKDINLTFKCEGKNQKVIMTHIGTATAFNPAAVQTNISDFGIQLSAYISQAGVVAPFNVGSSIVTHDGTGIPAGYLLSVVPVKRSGVTLGTGAFSGTSTLQFEYP